MGGTRPRMDEVDEGRDLLAVLRRNFASVNGYEDGVDLDRGKALAIRRLCDDLDEDGSLTKLAEFQDAEDEWEALAAFHRTLRDRGPSPEKRILEAQLASVRERRSRLLAEVSVSLEDEEKQEKLRLLRSLLAETAGVARQPAFPE